MPVTDLTGTTWVFNNTFPPHFPEKGEYYTEGDIRGLTPASDYGYFIDFIWKDENGEYNCNYIYNYNYDAGTTIGVATYPNGAAHYFGGTMTITGGTDATNADLITWLQANATQQATEITYTCKWYLDGTLVNTSTFTHEQLTGVDYNVLGSVFKVMLSASVLDQYDYGVNLNGETSNASLGSDNVITIEAFKSNIVFNITSNGTTTLATKNTYVPCDIDFNVNVPSVQLQEKSEYITSNTQTIITPDTGKALSKVTITTDVPQMTEVATSAEMDAKLKENNVSLYYKYTGTTDDKYTNGDIYQVQEG